jgi:hypothetical protein
VAVEVDPAGLTAWLAAPAGRAALDLAHQARRDHPGDATAAATALQRSASQLDPVQRATVLSQADLHERAAARYGLDASDLLLTRDGLEQATRPEVSAERVRLMALPAGSAIVDGTAGLGFDSRAFLAAGLQVTAVERDPAVVGLLRANAPEARIIHGDITDPAILGQAVSGADSPPVVFLDPARRGGSRSQDGSRARPERDPQRWSPPWSFAIELATRFRVCVKVTPGFSPDLVPEGWCATWISTRSGPAEACLLSWQGLPAARRACLVWRESSVHVDEDGLGAVPTAAVGTWLHEPAQVVVTARLVDALARRAGVSRVHPRSHWLTSDAPAGSLRTNALLASYRVLDELPTGAKAMRTALRQRGHASITIKSRGTPIDADEWRARLRMPEGPSALVAILATGDSWRAYLLGPARDDSSTDAVPGNYN